MPKSEKSVDNFWFDLFQTSCELHSSRQEDDTKPLSDYLKPKFKLPPKNSMQFLNLRKCYEKVQRRQDGISTQRPVDCNIRMLVKFDPAWPSRDVDVFVQRHPDSAKLCGDLNGRVRLEVKIGEKKDGLMYFSVDLDSIYQNNPNSPLYKLSTVDPLRRNTFMLIIRLSSTNLNRDQYFTSPSFLIRSRRPAKGSDKNGVENKELLIVDH